MKLIVIRKVEIEIMRDPDQNSYMSFLKNEFSKIFENLLRSSNLQR